MKKISVVALCHFQRCNRVHADIPEGVKEKRTTAFTEAVCYVVLAATGNPALFDSCRHVRIGREIVFLIEFGQQRVQIQRKSGRLGELTTECLVRHVPAVRHHSLVHIRMPIQRHCIVEREQPELVPGIANRQQIDSALLHRIE